MCALSGENRADDSATSGVFVSRRSGPPVNDTRKLTPRRRANSDPCRVRFGSLFGLTGRGDAAEVSVFESVAVSLQ
jgi:hypothetical protein